MDSEADEYLKVLQTQVRKFDGIPFFDSIRIQKAAQVLGMDVDDLLHEGGIGNIDILAPVMFAGSYEWLVGPEKGFYPELAEPARAYFDASNRVILSCEDILKIEAVGWAVPESFFSPETAGEIDWFLRQVIPEPIEKYEPGNAMTTSLTRGDVERSWISYFPAKLVSPDEQQDRKRRLAYRIAQWYSIERVPSEAVRTTKDHLFVSKDVVEKLLASKREKAPHGNAEKNALVREGILKAAIYCKVTWPDQCQKTTDWVSQVEHQAKLFWDDATIPLERQTVIDLLNKAIKKPDSPISSKKIKRRVKKNTLG